MLRCTISKITQTIRPRHGNLVPRPEGRGTNHLSQWKRTDRQTSYTINVKHRECTCLWHPTFHLNLFIIISHTSDSIMPFPRGAQGIHLCQTLSKTAGLWFGKRPSTFTASQRPRYLDYATHKVHIGCRWRLLLV